MSNQECLFFHYRAMEKYVTMVEMLKKVNTMYVEQIEKAIEYEKKSSELIDETTPNYVVEAIYSNIALFYDSLENTAETISYSKKALEYAENDVIIKKMKYYLGDGEQDDTL